MRILHTVEFYHPSVGGMQEAVQQISERLVRLGHDVTVATSTLPQREERVLNGVKIVEFAVSGNLARGLHGATKQYEEFLLGSSFDIIANFAAQQWATDVALPLLSRIAAGKVLVPTGFSGLYLPEFQQYFRQMESWLRQYDAVVFLSNDYRDARFASDLGVTTGKVIPNGASEEEFLAESGPRLRTLLGIPHDHLLVLHVGSHTGLKGHAEAIEIFRKARIRKATFLLVGNETSTRCAKECSLKARRFNLNPVRWRDEKRLIVTALERSHTVAAYKEANLFLFPSNVECSPIVLFECMASRTPFLSTDVGNSAEILKWSGSGLILPTRKDSKGFARADIAGSVRLFEEIAHDEPARIRLQESGFRAWQEKFTWNKIAADYEALYKTIDRRDLERTIRG